jgi:hypothetical protein
MINSGSHRMNYSQITSFSVVWVFIWPEEFLSLSLLEQQWVGIQHIQTLCITNAMQSTQYNAYRLYTFPAPAYEFERSTLLVKMYPKIEVFLIIACLKHFRFIFSFADSEKIFSG